MNSTFLICFLLVCLLRKIDTVLHGGSTNFLAHSNIKPLNDPQSMIHKVSFTQKGYIQFLRYYNEVPTLKEYTFCIWVRSNNLTYNHPLLSYSIHEEERLIRAWISPFGKHINLEILEVPVFSIEVNLKENRWYHVCQSWSSYQGTWSLYLNGKLRSTGYSPQLKHVPIEGGGDIVVGQEYTDFDKGLDDGIEGDVFGFNFVLSSTTNQQPIDSYNYPKRRRDNKRKMSRYRVKRMAISNREGQRKNTIFRHQPVYKIRYIDKSYAPYISYHDANKSLGQLLVELSYDCGYKKGAPLSGKGVLINWSKTPVRVFGGAILKTVPPFCAL